MMSDLDKLELAVKALLDIKRFTQDNYGGPSQRASITARDALIAVDRNPPPQKRHSNPVKRA
jgi:hypothetical protein